MPQKERRRVDDSHIGLKVLYEAEHPEIDIVAVHGIGAHPETTWGAEVILPNGARIWRNWLSDETMLRKTLPDIRVLNFGYKSDWFGNKKVHISLSTIGKSLWESLNMHREACQDRPIIFVAHCFGGLVVMRVLIERYQHAIIQATAGVAFLGTPFRGTDERFHTELPAMAEASIGTVHDHILQYLKEDNSTLKDLVVDFLTVRRNGERPHMPLVACFHECLETEVNGILGDPNRLAFIVVREGSASLDIATGVDTYPLQRDHFQLNKFASPDHEEFRLLCRVLKQFRDRAANDTKPLLKRVVASRKSSMQSNSQFDSKLWIEPSLEVFQVRGPADMIVETFTVKHEHVSRLSRMRRSEPAFKPLGSGISLDCKHMYLRDATQIRIYAFDKLLEYQKTKSIPPPVLCTITLPPNENSSNKTRIKGVSLGRTTCAYITETNCWIHRYIYPETNVRTPLEESKLIRQMSRDNTATLSCVAVSETTLEHDLLIVAMGIGQEQGELDVGQVEIFSIWQNDWAERTKIETMKLEDRGNGGMTDSPKTLAFSTNGALLTCTTQRCNQLHAWQLPTKKTIRNVKKVCEVSRRFNMGNNAKGITSATPWMSPSLKPYVICTTSPSTERDENIYEGGEWTFISPLSRPLPQFKDPAYHCLTQVQAAGSPHLHIHASAVSPQGNLLALLDGNGRICLIPIRARRKGGMVSGRTTEDGTIDARPIEIKEEIGRVDRPGQAGIRFSPEGTKLFASSWDRTLVITFGKQAPATPNKEVYRAPTWAQAIPGPVGRGMAMYGVGEAIPPVHGLGLQRLDARRVDQIEEEDEPARDVMDGHAQRNAKAEQLNANAKQLTRKPVGTEPRTTPKVLQTPLISLPEVKVASENAFSEDVMMKLNNYTFQR